MKNLAKYPLTVEEICSILLQIQIDCLEEKKYGDLRPVALQMAREIIEGISITYGEADADDA